MANHERQQRHESAENRFVLLQFLDSSFSSFVTFCSKRFAVLAQLLVIAVFVCQVHAATYHVEPNGVDDGGRDGLSWATAFATVKYAVGRSSSGDTVLVSNGYYEVTSATAALRGVVITSLNGSAYTILNGGGAASGTYGAFVTSGSGSGNIELYGLTMTNFYAANGVVSVSGGSEWRIGDCVFGKNSVNVGGGICISAASTANLYNCVLTGNEARGKCGGAVYIYGTDYGEPGLLRAYGTEFSSNYTTNGGGWNYGGGGLYLQRGATCELDDCTIVSNQSCEGTGAGIHAGYFAVGRVTVSNSLVGWNLGVRRAGGMYLRGADVRVVNTRITGNMTDGLGGGLRLEEGAIENCVIDGNIAGDRGGGVDLRTDAVMRNCTVVSNSSAGSYPRGGVNAGPATIVNTIIYHNLVSSGTLSNYSGISDTTIFYTNCLTAPDPATYGLGTDCLESNPMLGSTYPNNFRPVQGSPCINAGLNQAWMSSARDIDNHDRIAEFVVDIGAYEFHPPGMVIMFQ